MVRGKEPLDGVLVPVGMDHADVRVPAWCAVELRKYPEKMREQDAVHAAVADDEDRLARTLACETRDGAQRAPQDLIEGLPTGPRDEPVLIPSGESSGFVEILAGALADVDLAQLSSTSTVSPWRFAITSAVSRVRERSLETIRSNFTFASSSATAAAC